MVSSGAAGWPDARDGALRMGRACRRDLFGQRQALVADLCDGQLVAVDHGVDLGDERVQQAGDGGDQDERADEDAGVEVQAQQQGP